MRPSRLSGPLEPSSHRLLRSWRWRGGPCNHPELLGSFWDPAAVEICPAAAVADPHGDPQQRDRPAHLVVAMFRSRRRSRSRRAPHASSECYSQEAFAVARCMALLLESAFRECGWNAHKHVESTDGMLTVPTMYRCAVWSRQISNARARSQLSAAQARRSSGERNHVRVRRSTQLQADRDERWAGRIYFLGFGYAKAWEIYSAAASTSRIHSSSLPYRGPRAH